MLVNLLAFGKHVVQNVINSDFFIIEKTVVLDEKKNDQDIKKILDTIKKKNIKIINLDIKKFKNISPERSQGIVLFIKKYFYSSLNTILQKKSNHKKKFFLMLDSIEDPQNFGSIIRTASALNIDGIIITEKNQVMVNNTVIKVSSGGIAHVPICIVSNLKIAIVRLKDENFRIISSVCSNKSDFYFNTNRILDNVCLILGNEEKGIKKSILDISDSFTHIPVFNNMNSLSVSVSCAILSSHIVSLII